MLDSIPNHLFANILLRLPFESLLQSRRVSKSWRSLIDSPEFVRMHFDAFHLKSSKSQDNETFRIVSSTRNNFYTLDFDDIGAGKAIAKRLKPPLDHLGSDEVRLVGSCNGLLCLVYPNSSTILVWNPWIQKAWELPSPPVEYSMFGGADSLLGFGYDSVNDDYKVFNKMRFYDVFDEDQSTWSDEVYVYCFKYSSWRKMEHFQTNYTPSNSFFIPRDGSFVSGALHWMGGKDQNGVIDIMAFDLSTEEFRKMACPRQPERSFIYPHKLVALNGFLCFVSFYYGEDGGKCVDLWLMEEYGKVESWIKLTTIKLGYTDMMHMFCGFTPLAYSKNSRGLLSQIDGEKFLVYDFETQKMSDLRIDGAQVSFLHSVVNVGSLIRPHY
ncbi:OLC1v1038851C1 [Oldenlandia corymbosa var. corymbosa]|uniref:OLC1v1038851C1 n=1 Tax=Oldenlandia corymbosa var. corymbosa TaxID=529605 RepID=A0AAV1D2B9_OLDCO|nr:OLC1v1038851C1 [Oldenlandia corymbosa var. corymbosa]